MLNKDQKKLVLATLTNDENSTDEELVQYFVNEVKIDKAEAISIVNKRNYYIGILKPKFSPAELGEQAAKKEYYQNQTNFPTTYETRLGIQNALIEARMFAKDIIRIAEEAVNFDGQSVDFNNKINSMDDKVIDNIADEISNRLTLAAEYIRDLKKF